MNDTSLCPVFCFVRVRVCVYVLHCRDCTVRMWDVINACSTGLCTHFASEVLSLAFYDPHLFWSVQRGRVVCVCVCACVCVCMCACICMCVCVCVCVLSPSISSPRCLHDPNPSPPPLSLPCAAASMMAASICSTQHRSHRCVCVCVCATFSPARLFLCTQVCACVCMCVCARVSPTCTHSSPWRPLLLPRPVPSFASAAGACSRPREP